MSNHFYCDLNLVPRDFQKLESDKELFKLVATSLCDGYYNLALNYEQNDLSQQVKPCFWKKMPLDQIELEIKSSSNLLQDLPKLDKLSQFTRITIEINEPRYLNQLHENGSKQLSTYDLIAVKTKNEKIFQSICTEQDCQNFDIITFDISDQLLYTVKKTQILEVIRKGISIEICYSSAISDKEKKKQVLSNCLEIIKATKGKNLIISSQAYNFIYHRSPFDLVAIFSVLGLSQDKTIAALQKNAIACLQRSKQRKLFKGTITEAKKSDIDQFRQKEEKFLAQLSKKIKSNKEWSQNIKQKKMNAKQKQESEIQVEETKANQPAT